VHSARFSGTSPHQKVDSNLGSTEEPVQVTIEAGQQLLHYRLLEKIGEGGMGVVWRATDTRLDREVAIKVLRHQLSNGTRARERFEREARTISSLNHPHICTLYDIGCQDEIDFIVMEHLEGESLAERLQEGALPLEQALRHGIEISEALHEAHKTGMVHRDLKPGNIMLTRQGAKLMDFGLAKIVRPSTETGARDASVATTAEQPLTEMGTLIGTVPYMSPEQLEGKEADARADIFALGSVVYEMITGRRAFTGTSQASLISAIMTAEPPPLSELQPDAPPVLDHLIRRCLAKDPDDRWHSVLDLAHELEWIAESAEAKPTRSAISKAQPSTDYRIEYLTGPDGASIAAARGGSGPPLLVVPTMVDTIETSWAVYATAFGDHELITYDRRGTGLSERGSAPGEPEPYLQDAQAVVDGFGLEEFDVFGTLLATTEAAWVASRNADRVKHLVLRAPTIGLEDWATIPGVRAALATMEHDWEYFTESFGQFIVGWGNPNGPKVAERFRAITSRDELRALLEAFMKLDLASIYAEIQAPTLIEHHPGYFFPDTYSRHIASMIPDCRMAIFSGADSEFINDLTIASTFLSGK
jgi:serine/threonine protein kinase